MRKLCLSARNVLGQEGSAMKEKQHNPYEYTDLPEETMAQPGLIEELPDVAESLELEAEELSDLTDYILLASEELGKSVDQEMSHEQLHEELQRWVIAAPTEPEARFIVDTAVSEDWATADDAVALLTAWKTRKNAPVQSTDHIETSLPTEPPKRDKRPVITLDTDETSALPETEKWRLQAARLTLENAGWDLINTRIESFSQAANTPDGKTAKLAIAQAIADKRLDARDTRILNFFKAEDPRPDVQAYQEALQQSSDQFWRDIDATGEIDQLLVGQSSPFSLEEAQNLLSQIARKRVQLMIEHIRSAHQRGEGPLARRIQQQAAEHARERGEEQEERLKALRASRWQRRKGGRRSSLEPTAPGAIQRKNAASGNFLAYAQEAEEHKKFLDALLDNASELEKYRSKLRGADLEEFDHALEERKSEHAWEQQENTRFSELTRVHSEAVQQWEDFQKAMEDLLAISDPNAEPFSHTGYATTGREESITPFIELFVDPFSFAPLRNDMLMLINLHGEIARLHSPQVNHNQQVSPREEVDDAATEKPAAIAEESKKLRVSVQNRFAKPKKTGIERTEMGLETLRIHVHPIALDHLIKNVHGYMKEIRLAKPQRDDLTRILHRLAWWKKHGGVDQLTYRSILQEPMIESMQTWHRRRTAQGQMRPRRLSTKS